MEELVMHRIGIVRGMGHSPSKHQNSAAGTGRCGADVSNTKAMTKRYDKAHVDMRSDASLICYIGVTSTSATMSG
jgi:hypothetical protein